MKTPSHDKCRTEGKGVFLNLGRVQCGSFVRNVEHSQDNSWPVALCQVSSLFVIINLSEDNGVALWMSDKDLAVEKMTTEFNFL